MQVTGRLVKKNYGNVLNPACPSPEILNNVGNLKNPRVDVLSA